MSACPADFLVQQGRFPPGTKTLEKPFDEKALASAIQEALAREPRPSQGSGGWGFLARIGA